MAKYSIPAPFKKGFIILSTIDSKSINEMCDIIKSLPAGMGIENITKNVTLGLGEKIEEDDIEEVIRAYFSLIRFSKENSIDFNEFIEDVVNSFEEPELYGHNLKENLLKLYQVGTKIFTTIKANNLLGEYENLFTDCRILSDIRIIFNEDFSNKDQNAVVVHQLKIDYVRHGESKQTFFALDANDLRKLKIAIERALEKDKNIKSNVYQNNLEFIELTK